MAIIVSNIRAGLSKNEDDVIDIALSKIKRSRGEAVNAYIIKKSVDARHKDISIVYSVGIELVHEADERAAVAAANDKDVRYRAKTEYSLKVGTERLSARPIVVGFGPAGMFAGLLLAQYGYRPLIIERGAPVEERVAAVERFWSGGAFDAHTNVQFGEGGAGTFSDGKLTTRISDPRCDMVIDEFVKNGAPQIIKQAAKPHIGTDNLRTVVKNIRNKIISLGGEIRFNSKLTDIEINGGKVNSVFIDGEKTEAGAVILALGHSARDTFSILLQKGISIVPKPFSVGVRIEHLQKEIDKALYGEFAGHPALPKGEYQLSLRKGERAVYTFCMCPGGLVVAAASQEGGVVTNGMSYYKRDGDNANAALAVSVSPKDFGHNPVDGINFQERLERAAFAAGGGGFRAPCQTVGDFLAGTNTAHFGRVVPTYSVGVNPYNLEKLFPKYITEMLRCGIRAFDKKLRGFAASDSVLTGVETRTSSPVRILRDNETFEALGVSGLYPAGEGAGYAGGIVSAAVDGLRTAESIIKKYAPID